jgi:hypothetical protein
MARFAYFPLQRVSHSWHGLCNYDSMMSAPKENKTPHAKANRIASRFTKTPKVLIEVLMKQSLVLFVIIAFLAALMGGCSQSSNPVTTPEKTTLTSGNPSTKVATPSVIPNPPNSKPWPNISQTVNCTPLLGGNFSLSYSYKTTSGTTCTRTVSFLVPPLAVNKNTEITMSLDSTCVGVDFQPEGLVFLVPSILNYSVTGLDESQLQGNVTFDYVGTGGLVPVVNQLLTVSLQEGSITMLAGIIPHFSRYAFAR